MSSSNWYNLKWSSTDRLADRGAAADLSRRYQEYPFTRSSRLVDLSRDQLQSATPAASTRPIRVGTPIRSISPHWSRAGSVGSLTAGELKLSTFDSDGWKRREGLAERETGRRVTLAEPQQRVTNETDRIGSSAAITTRDPRFNGIESIPIHTGWRSLPIRGGRLSHSTSNLLYDLRPYRVPYDKDNTEMNVSETITYKAIGDNPAKIFAKDKKSEEKYTTTVFPPITGYLDSKSIPPRPVRVKTTIKTVSTERIFPVTRSRR